ncbi:MAG: NAD(P)H-hydrate dehydratase, partial [Acidobacteriota bacterium]
RARAARHHEGMAKRAEVDLGSLESMTLAVDLATSAGVDALIRAAEGKASLAVGPGLGTDDRIGAVVRRLLAEIDVPLVLDADALTVLAGDLEPLRDRAAAERATVLTPHPGEMGRLLGRSTAEVQGDRLATVRAAVDATRAVVILKGRRSLVSAPDGGVWIDPTGNSGLATGGTGDVLTGLVAGLLAQGVPALDAARLGASVHGTAGDLAAERIGRRALAAGDVVDSLGAAWRHLLGDAA